MRQAIANLLKRFENTTLSAEDYQTTIRDIMYNVDQLVKQHVTFSFTNGETVTRPLLKPIQGIRTTGGLRPNLITIPFSVREYEEWVLNTLSNALCCDGKGKIVTQRGLGVYPITLDGNKE